MYVLQLICHFLLSCNYFLQNWFFQTDSMQTLSVMSSSATTSNNDIILRNDINGSKSSTLSLQHSVPHIRRIDLQENDTGMLRQIPLISNCGRLKYPSFDLPYRPRASIEPFQVISLHHRL